MTPSRPYLIRSMYEWICDNNMTPYIVIRTDVDNVQVPMEFVEDNRIVLNIAPHACRGLHLENDRIVFSARFSGVSKQIAAHPRAVMAIYAKENGRGMIFGEDEEETTSGGAVSTTPVPGTDKSSKRPNLTVIK